MKKLLILIIFQVTTIISFSQAGCPNVDAGPNQNLACTGSCASLVAVPFETGATSTYEVTSIPYNPPYPFNAGIPAFVGIDDIWSDIISLPFNFCFFGNTYNQIVIGANGLITFDIANANMYCPWPFTNSIPNPALPLNSISGAYHDIDPSICGNIYYDVFGLKAGQTKGCNWMARPSTSFGSKAWIPRRCKVGARLSRIGCPSITSCSTCMTSSSAR